MFEIIQGNAGVNFIYFAKIHNLAEVQLNTAHFIIKIFHRSHTTQNMKKNQIKSQPKQKFSTVD